MKRPAGLPPLVTRHDMLARLDQIVAFQKQYEKKKEQKT